MARHLEEDKVSTTVATPSNVPVPRSLGKGIAVGLASFLVALALGLAIDSGQPEAPVPGHPGGMTRHDGPITDRQEMLTRDRVGRHDQGSPRLAIGLGR
jgi:hypothetical protein